MVVELLLSRIVPLLFVALLYISFLNIRTTVSK